MIGFTPPVKHLAIGQLRSIELFDWAESVKLTPGYAYLLKSRRVKKVFDGHLVQVIGNVDVGSAMLYDPSETVFGVHVDSVYQAKALTQIADSIDKLYRNVLIIAEVWLGKESLISLENTPENLLLRTRVIDEIARNNPRSDAGFWNFLAFRELDITLSI